jgi:hypothetical protein
LSVAVAPEYAYYQEYLPVKQTGDANVKVEYRLFSKEEQDKVSVDKAAAAVAWQERMNKPVVHELVDGNSLNTCANISVNGSAYID